MENKNEWIDITSYSRGEKERTPSVWAFDTGKIRIVVLKGHIYYPGKWCFKCYTLNIDTTPLNIPIETELSEVQAIAISTAKKILTQIINSLPT